MLGFKKAQSLFSYHLHAIKHSLNLFCQKPLGTLMTTVVIAMALALPTLFWVFTDKMNQLTSNWKQSAHISLYLKPSLSQEDQIQLIKTVQNLQGVGQTTLKSADEGLSELTQQEGMHDLMRYLPENPLPSVIEVEPALSTDSAAKLELLVTQLQKLPQVDQVKLDMAWMNRLQAILGFASNLVHALMTLLALAVVFIIGNTLRLSLQSRQEEIQVLKLIGAADAYILRPFLYTGVWYGIAGAFLAVFLINIFILNLGAVVNQLASAYQMNYEMELLSIRRVLLLILFAIILGWLGAWLSVKRQLTAIEPKS